MAPRTDQPLAFITGLDSFTGKFLSEELRGLGFVVTGTRLSGTADNHNGYCVDICEAAALEDAILDARPNIVAHLAGISFVAHDDVEELYRVNILGTRNLLAACSRLEHKPDSILLASTGILYGNGGSTPIDENGTISPVNDYSISKLAMESLARLWSDELPINITRSFNYTGVGQSGQFLLPKIVSHFSRQEACIELGNTEISRDWSDVRDVARYFSSILNSQYSGETFNICSGHSHTLNDVLTLLQDISGHSVNVRVNPNFIRKNEAKILCGDNSKLQRLIGVQPQYTLRDTLDWMYQSSCPVPENPQSSN